MKTTILVAIPLLLLGILVVTMFALKSELTSQRDEACKERDEACQITAGLVKAIRVMSDTSDARFQRGESNAKFLVQLLGQENKKEVEMHWINKGGEVFMLQAKVGKIYEIKWYDDKNPKPIAFNAGISLRRAF